MAGRDSSPRFEDGYLSSSDSGRSCSAPPPARRLPRDENATPWGEETCSPFRRLSVSDRRGGGRQGGEELQRQDQQPQKQQHSPARPPQPPQQQVYTPPPKKQQPEQQPEQQQEKQLPSNVLGNKPDFMAEGGAADGLKFASDREEDAHRIAQRQKQIDYGKNTTGYDRYRQLVPIYKRKDTDPRTPDRDAKMSKRRWAGRVRDCSLFERSFMEMCLAFFSVDCWGEGKEGEGGGEQAPVG
eukprot:jgi/Undpi1/12830/HiC_scaffold_7.g02497.m1